MTLKDRMRALRVLFSSLEDTSGRNNKICLINQARLRDEQLSKDIDYCFEILDGQHKIGYSLLYIAFTGEVSNYVSTRLPQEISLREFLEPAFTEERTQANIYTISQLFIGVSWFVTALLNREWRLGIGKSQLQKQVIEPMLAKKYEPDKQPKASSIWGYYVTEKLDGNRCISIYNNDANQWEFWSRSGKQLKVSFDMSGMPKDLMFDGEILSIEQLNIPSQANFNALSGALNSKYGNKDGFVYMIFDIPNSRYNYAQRRILLNSIKPASNNVRILPILHKFDTWEELNAGIGELLSSITSRGGEGVMINVGSAKYEQKRTDVLLKLKEVQSMDMRVVGVLPGTGKNTGLVGSLICLAKEGNKVYQCSVGSGLSDDQRYLWACDEDLIIGKIVEVQYFSLSQAAGSRGSDSFTLRFPRLKQIRRDKNETSTY